MDTGKDRPKTNARLRALALALAFVMVFLGTLFGSFHAFADDSRSLRFRHVTLKDGLSQSYVFSIAQDHQGYMWFGTQDGLNRYDGYEFIVFTHDSYDPDSISDESIRTVFVDRSGTLWIGTDFGGMSRYVADSETFVNYRHDPRNADSISNNRVRVIYEDSSGTMWVGTDGSGLDRFDRDSGVFEHFPHDPSRSSSLAGAHVWSILESADGALFVATDGGLSQFDPDTETFTHFKHDSDDPSSIRDNHVRVLYEDAERNIWIGTNSGGLSRFDRDAGSFEHFIHSPDDESSLSANSVNSIFQDTTGVLWIGTVNGLNAWDTEARKFNRYLSNSGDVYSLSHDNVNAIFQDRSGVLWVGTYKGLNAWSITSRAMLHFRNDANDPRSLNNNTIMSFAEDGSGNVWVATYGGGLNLLDRRSNEFHQLMHEPGNENSLSSDRVMYVTVDRDGVLWAGTLDAGLNRYDSGTNTFARFRHDPADPTSLSFDGVSAILEDRSGTLWIGTFGGGLNSFDRETNRFRHYKNDPLDANTLSNDRIFLLFEDSAGYIWIGTYGGGLNQFDPSTGKFKAYRTDPERADSLSGDEIYMIQEDTQGDFWIGVKGRGLNHWRHADRKLGKDTFRRFSIRDGLPSSTIYSGVWDQSGYLWLSTGHGLSRLDTGSLEFKNYDNSHGLQGDEYNLTAGLITADGQVFFGGVNGFNAFYPNLLAGNRQPPQVAITRFLILNTPVDAFPMQAKAGRLQLDHDQNVIGFEFAALDYAAPHRNRFMYRLDGFDDDWVDAGVKRQVTYVNLPAGEYTFRVRASNNEGIWSQQDAVLDFQMNPAPWQTWWAFTSYLLILAAIAAALIRGHARRARNAAALEHAKELSIIQGRLTEAQHIAGIGNWVWNVAGNKLWWSDEIYNLFGLDKETTRISYDRFIQCVHPDDRKTVNDAVERAIRGGESYSIEYRVCRGEGTERIVNERARAHLDAAGRPVKMAGIVHDITDRKRAENDIRHRAEFEALLAHLSSGLIRAQPDDVEQQVNLGLERVAMHYGLDAINIRWLPRDKRYLESCHHWTRLQEIEPPKYLTHASYPWVVGQMQAGEPVVVADVEQMPASASTDRVSFKERGIRAFILIPMLFDEKVVGSAGFAMVSTTREWCEETVHELKLISENIAGAIARAEAVTQIKKLTEELREENFYLRQEVNLAQRFDEIIGEDSRLKQCLQQVEKVAPTDVAVLILGETGTGKELFARAIHRLSKRRDGPMISVNCPALPSTLIESELFGHEKGAFTGADSRRLGRFEMAEGGTLFLDEIGELPLEVQSKLLRVLQTGEFDRLGGIETRGANVRLIAATNRDLRQAVADGEFRADLFYRINSFPINLPALRERKNDIPLLSEHFVHRHARRLGKTINAMSARMIRELVNYEWPGNVRELESIIERAMISAGGEPVLELPAPLRLIGHFTQSKAELLVEDGIDLTSVERAHIIDVLDKTNWKISGKDGAATALGIPSSTLRSKMKRLGISRPSVYDE
jgi:PAS domain S-box-containing protein